MVFVLVVMFVAPVSAVNYSPGVKMGDYVKYGNYVTLNGTHVISWEKVEVIAVSGKEVTFLTTGQFKNGTALPEMGMRIINLETGATNETHSDLKSIMAANLNEGDAVPPGTFVVNKTEIRTYLGVSRVVNVLIEEIPTDFATTRVTVVYDKASGMAVAWETWAKFSDGRQIAFSYEVVETNLWEVSPSPSPTPEYLYFIIAAAAVAIPITAVVVIRKRKQSKAKAKMQEQKVMDLTYNLSGVNRGECYLTDSLEPCLKIVSDLHTRGVNGLCIVREDPELVIKNYNLKLDDVVLLSSQPVKGFKAISSLQEIAIAITKFLKAGGGVVLLEGLAYLISRFGFNTVYMFMQEKHIEFLEARAVLLVPVNMGTLDSKEKSQLLSELKLL